MEVLRELWQFLTTDKTWGQPIFASLIAGLVVLVLQMLTHLPFMFLRRLLGLFVRWQAEHVNIDIKTFDVITDPATLLPKLYSEEKNPDVLAHHRIPYQRRDLDRDIQAELRAILNDTRYLLITASTGIGKTREAATLAQSLMIEGYRVVRVKTGWLDVPKEFPKELGSDRRRVLILLDDLNGLFRTGGFRQSPKAGQIATFNQPSYHNRLQSFLRAFEKMCGENEIRVIATARDEADEWKILEFDPVDALWRQFGQITLPEPNQDAIVELLEQSVALAHMEANRAEFPDIARINDGTFENVVSNLKRLRRENQKMTAHNYNATLNGSWREVYERAVRKHNAVRYVYDAMDLLQQIDVPLLVIAVAQMALEIWGGNRIERWNRKRKVMTAMKYLVIDQDIIPWNEYEMTPRDGQIEAKPYQVDWKAHGTQIEALARKAENWEELRLKPTGWLFWAGLGTAMLELPLIPVRVVRVFEKVIALKPDFAYAHFFLGLFLVLQRRLPEAEKAFSRGLSQDPKIAELWSFLGYTYLLDQKERDAIPCLEKAKDLEPENYALPLYLAYAHDKLGNKALSRLYEEQARLLVKPNNMLHKARIEMISGNTQSASEALCTGISQGLISPWLLEIDPVLHSLKSNPAVLGVLAEQPSSHR